jgi:Fe-S cluster assembly scaffold IscU
LTHASATLSREMRRRGVAAASAATARGYHKNVRDAHLRASTWIFRVGPPRHAPPSVRALTPRPPSPPPAFPRRSWTTSRSPATSGRSVRPAPLRDSFAAPPALGAPRCLPRPSDSSRLTAPPRSPPFLLRADKSDANVGTGLVGAPACGDVMKLQIRVDDDGNIVDSCFKTFGCGSAIASSSVVSEWVKGQHVDEAVTIKNSEIAKHLNLPPVKLHCSMLAEDAIKAAVEDLKKKRAAAAAE